MTLEEALVEEWGDAGLPGKGDRDAKKRESPPLRKTNAKSGRAKPRDYRKRRKEWRHELASTRETRAADLRRTALQRQKSKDAG
jgi:hypothetical protein